jgi:endo-1,4-beta-xylanase
VPVGAAVDPTRIARDEAYVTTLAREFGSLTPENAMKWGPVHPARDVWNFGPADRIVEFAEANRMAVHGHALVWHRQLPAWVTEAMTPHELASAMALHIRDLVGRYRGRVASWDVVNEAAADGGGLRDTLFLRKLGVGYIAAAFRLAHAADPTAQLYYNDYGAEGRGSKADAVHALVRDLADEGVPIHGVGLQMHLDAAASPPPAQVAANVRRLAALGLTVRVSEMDVRIRNLRRRDALEVQAAVYRDILRACVHAPGFAGVTFWGVADPYSWIASSPGEDAPLLFGDSCVRKPAYFGVRDALIERELMVTGTWPRERTKPDRAVPSTCSRA